MPRLKSLCFVVALAAAAVAAAQAPQAARAALVGTKLRILVDKVMQPEEGWVTKEWMIKETADAGFNVYSPRHGYDKLDEVRQVTAWCATYGICHMPWMRGTLSAPAGAAADGRRMLWATGVEQPLWSPNADEFWDWTTRYITEYARIGAQHPNLIGVFLDYENYAPGKSGNCYDLSYDDLILGQFAKTRGIELPALKPGERKTWLEKQDLHAAFAEFQVAHWRERCRTLRQAVDKLDPTFRFCIYPAPGTPFMVEACYPEWSTAAAPIILADPWVYGRPSRFHAQKTALEVNRQTLLRGLEVPRKAGIPFVYAGGIDPVCAGADPEFCGKNAVMISDITDGYWVFYEGPKYKGTHKDYFRWFAWANRAIAEKRLQAWQEPRGEPESLFETIFGQAKTGTKLVAPPTRTETVKHPKVVLRGENLVLVAAKAGQATTLDLVDVPVGNNEAPIAWEVRDNQFTQIASGSLAHKSSGTVTWTSPHDALCLLGASAGGCAWSIVSANAPLGLHARDWLHIFQGVERLYFHVPAETRTFTMTVRGSGAETVRLTVFDPDGKPAGTVQTTPTQGSATLTVSPTAGTGKTWSLSLTKADVGTLEDSEIRLGPELPPVLALRPEDVFGAER